MCANIRQKAYPVVEKNGILFAYMGGGRAAAVSAFRLLHRARDATPSRSRASSTATGCSRSRSASIPAHTSFLHRFFHDEDMSQGYGQLFRDKSIDSDMPMTRIMREHPRPQIDVEPTDYGLRIVTLRRISDANTHVRVTNLLFPHAFCIPMSAAR